MAEGAPLLRVYRGDSIEGSNPSLTAIYIQASEPRLTSGLFCVCRSPREGEQTFCSRQSLSTYIPVGNPSQGSSRAKRANIGACDDNPEGAKSAAMSNPYRILTAIYIQASEPRLTSGLFCVCRSPREGEQDFVPDKS